MIKEIQKRLQESSIDGWLLYDCHRTNALAHLVLQIPHDRLVSRRFFYWIPARGEPVQIVHQIEPDILSMWPGQRSLYLKWQELHLALRSVLKGSRQVAMEYSPYQAIPALGGVDAGLIDLIRSFGVEVVSSGDLLQPYTAVLDDAQLASHREAAQFLDQLAAKTWEKIHSALVQEKRIDECDVQAFMKGEMLAHGFVMEGMPICAVNAHSASPHFEPSKGSSAPIQKGDFVLIDLWCKKNIPRSVYGDITRVAVAGELASDLQNQIFSTVRLAQQVATDFVTQQYRQGKRMRGCEVDRVCRQVIEEAGYASFFTHRTGHNIYTEGHGPGAHLDSLETDDTRFLIPGTCFSIEPGIYLPGKFGVRLEYDVYLGKGGKAEVTGGVEEELLCLF